MLCVYAYILCTTDRPYLVKLWKPVEARAETPIERRRTSMTMTMMMVTMMGNVFA